MGNNRLQSRPDVQAGPRVALTASMRKFLESEIRAKWKHDPGRAEFECFRALCGMATVRPRATARRVSRCIGTWIETYCYIKTKAKEVRTIVMNPAQRKMLARVLRKWRNGETSEMIVLKPRQTGFSTFSELLMLTMAVLENDENCCVMGNKDEVSIKVKRIFRLALSKLPYRLPTRHNVGLLTEFREPHNSILSATSSQATDPGHGDTLRGLHLTEVARWKDGEEQAKGIMNTVPQSGRVVVIWESTANGAEGYFYNIFWDAVNGVSKADALFIPWYEHPEYTVTELSSREAQHVIATLDDEEKDLLTRTYFVRKEGIRAVTVNQLAWRRNCIADPKRCHNDLDAFHEQYPSTPEEAFLSSGRPVFDLNKIHTRLQNLIGPIFVGDIEDMDYKVMNEPEQVPEKLDTAYEEFRSLEDITFEESMEMMRTRATSLPVNQPETVEKSQDKLVVHGPSDQNGWPTWYDEREKGTD